MRKLRNTANTWQDQAGSHVSAPHTAADFFSVGMGGKSPSLSRLTHKYREGEG